MLQKPGHGSPLRIGSLEELERSLDKAVSKAEDSSRALVEFSRGSGHLVTTYTGLGSVAAWVFTGFHSVLAQAPHTDPLPAYHASLHIAPYREAEYRVVHWMGSPWERGETARLADALYIMNVPALYVVPDERDPLILQKIPEGSTLEAAGLVEQVMLASLSSLQLSVEKTGRGDMRVRRLERQLLSPQGVVEGLWSTYGAQLEEIVSWARRGERGLTLLHTRLMTPGALVMAGVLRSLGVDVAVWEASSHPPGMGKRVLLVYTSTEADVWRDVYFRRMREGGSPVKGLELRTDPLSAQVYGVLLGLMMGLAGGEASEI